jgi:1,6-anhydro-N-acetylmuramate kinase
MSGTSADGIDTALVRLEGDPLAPSWEIISFRTDPFSSQLREQILAAAAADSTTIPTILREGFLLPPLPGRFRQKPAR